MEKLKLLPFEMFEEIFFDSSLKLRYAISNKGRLISFENDITVGRMVKGSIVNGYRVFRYKIYRDRKVINKHKMFSRMVAETFLPKPTENQTLIKYLDFTKTNNQASNLIWVTQNELADHSTKSPLAIASKQKLRDKPNLSPNAKLSYSKVVMIKKMLASPNQTRQKMIAKRFGVSATQIKRIQRGENWSKVVI